MTSVKFWHVDKQHRLRTAQ